MGEVEARKVLRRQVLRDFAKFLKQKKVYNQYRRNLADCVIREKYRYCDKKEKTKLWCDAFQYGIYIKVLHNGCHKLNYEKCRELVNYAFTWSETPENHTFWNRINNEWITTFVNKYHSYRSTLDEK